MREAKADVVCVVSEKDIDCSKQLFSFLEYFNFYSDNKKYHIKCCQLRMSLSICWLLLVFLQIDSLSNIFQSTSKQLYSKEDL